MTPPLATLPLATPPLATLSIAAGAGIVAALGALHLYLTFVGERLHPRDFALRHAMDAVSLVLTRETTVWRAWIGFNASHGLGAILFGAAYLHLALVRPEVLRASLFLSLLGAGYLAAMAALARRNWFRTPFRGLVLAGVLYAIGMVALHAQA